MGRCIPPRDRDDRTRRWLGSQNVKTKAIRDGVRYAVSGLKAFITNGGQVD
jgi:hypothetical protein